MARFIFSAVVAAASRVSIDDFHSAVRGTIEGDSHDALETHHRLTTRRPWRPEFLTQRFAIKSRYEYGDLCLQPYAGKILPNREIEWITCGNDAFGWVFHPGAELNKFTIRAADDNRFCIMASSSERVLRLTESCERYPTKTSFMATCQLGYCGERDTFDLGSSSEGYWVHSVLGHPEEGGTLHLWHTRAEDNHNRIQMMVRRLSQVTLVKSEICFKLIFSSTGCPEGEDCSEVTTTSTDEFSYRLGIANEEQVTRSHRSMIAASLRLRASIRRPASQGSVDARLRGEYESALQSSVVMATNTTRSETHSIQAEAGEEFHIYQGRTVYSFSDGTQTTVYSRMLRCTIDLLTEPCVSIS